MKKTLDTVVLIVLAALPLLGCSSKFGLRHFAGPVLPKTEQAGERAGMGTRKRRKL